MCLWVYVQWGHCGSVTTSMYSCMAKHYMLWPYVGGVIKDQAEADEDTSLKERAAMAVGKQ